MRKQNGKHRAPYRLLRYPIPVYIYYWKNQWYCFIKPRLKVQLRDLGIELQRLKAKAQLWLESRKR